MGGKLVKPNKAFTPEELEDIGEFLNADSVGERTKMIAEILHQLSNDVAPTEIAKDLINTFEFSNSKDPYGTTLTTIYRVVKVDINQNGLTAKQIIVKRGAAESELERWPERKIIDTLEALHDEHGEEFSYDIIKKNYPRLLSVMERNVNFNIYLKRAGINPTIHLKDFV